MKAGSGTGQIPTDSVVELQVRVTAVGVKGVEVGVGVEEVLLVRLRAVAERVQEMAAVGGQWARH